MIVTERLDAKPICDVHHAPMQDTRYEASNISMTLHAHACTVQNCTRVYQHGQGYHDIGNSVSFDKRLMKECPECHTTMYLASVDAGLREEGWECGRRDCGYKETVRTAIYCGVFCKVCPSFIEIDRFDAAAPRGLILDRDNEIWCPNCGARNTGYTKADVVSSSSPDGKTVLTPPLKSLACGD